MKQDFIENELIVISKQTLDLFLKQKNSADIIAVYIFYYYTAKWQKTNQPKCTDTYVRKGLSIGKKTFGEAKKFLIDNDLIKVINSRGKTGKITGWFIKVNYIWKLASIPKMEIDQSYQNLPSGEQDTNALSANSINALNTNIIDSTDLITKQEAVSSSLFGNLPLNRGKDRIERVMSVYIDLFKSKYGITPFNFKITDEIIDALSKYYTEIQISALLISFFNWAGMSGDDDFARQKLIDAVHPFGWFYKTVSQHEVYLKNAFGLKFDDEYEVREFVKNYLLDLKNNNYVTK